MARLPDISDIRRVGPRETGGLTPTANNTQFSTAFGKLGETVVYQGESLIKENETLIKENEIEQKRIYQEREKLNFARAKSLFTIKKLEQENFYKDDSDYTTFTSRYDEGMKQAGEDALNMVNDPQMRGLLEVDLAEDYARGRNTVADLARVKEKDAGVAATLSGIEQNKRAFFATDNPEQKRAIIENSMTMLKSAAGAGYITQEEAVVKAEGLQNDLATTRLTMLPKDQQIQALTPKESASGEYYYEVTGTLTDFIPTDKKAEMYNNLRKEGESLLRTDKVKYLQDFKGVSAPADIVDYQVKMGIAPSAAQVLSNDQAKDMASAFMNISNPQQFVIASQKLKDEFPGYKANVVKDMVGQKLSPDVFYMLNLDPQKESEQVELLFGVYKDPKATEDLFKANLVSMSPDDFRVALNDSVRDELKLMYDEGFSDEAIVTVRNSTQNLAMAHFNKYGDESAAITYAEDTLKSDYVVAEVNNSSFRVPSAYDAQDIEFEAERLISENEIYLMDKGKVVSSEKLGANMKDKVRWVTNAEADGIVLKTEKYAFALDKEGKPIEYKFDDLKRLSDSRKETLKSVDSNDIVGPKKSLDTSMQLLTD